jgi:hypothetical protein
MTKSDFSGAVPPLLPVPGLEIEDALTKDRVKILAWGYYVHGSINMVMVSFLLIHLALFSVISFMPGTKRELSEEVTVEEVVQAAEPVDASEEAAQPMTVGESIDTLVKVDEGKVHRGEDFRQMQMIMRWMAAVVAMVILAGWAFGLLTIYAGRCLIRRRHRTFVLVMGALNSILIPYGTILGICTFVLLSKPSTRRLFGLSDASPV